MATGMSGATSILAKLKHDPIRQLEMQQAEGTDNRAVSQEDRMLGKQVAGEQKKLLASKKFGDELAMRKDKLAFAKKVQAESQSMAEERMSMEESRFSHDTIFKGLEIGIMGAGIGVGYYRNKRSKEQAAITKSQNDELIGLYKRHICMSSPMLGYSSGMSPEDLDYGG